MSEPRRLLEEGGDDLAVSLLRSARHDAPSSASRRQTLAALGLGAGAAVTVAAATSTAASAAKSGATAALLKWIGVGVVGGLVTVSAVVVVQSPVTTGPQTAPAAVTTGPQAAPNPVTTGPQAAPNPVTTGPQAAPTPALPRSAEPRPSEPAPAIAPSPSAEPVATAAPEAPSPSPARAPLSADTPAQLTLADEVAALDAARSALASGQAAGALRALDDHDRRFPAGVLGPEATVLRIEALALRGDRGSAASLARAFLAAHPRSPHAARVRSVALPAEETAP